MFQTWEYGTDLWFRWDRPVGYKLPAVLWNSVDGLMRVKEVREEPAAMDGRVWTEVTGLLDTLNDCVKEYARLLGLGDMQKWGKDMKFIAETEMNLLERLVAHKATIEGHASYFAVCIGNTWHGMTDILGGIAEGMKAELDGIKQAHLEVLLEALRLYAV